ncbi:MAG: TonB-dependent receptor, partial [Bacteroidales bacterium]|nr:TonB-dependent receptor [Bacteroidales bacterium]
DEITGEWVPGNSGKPNPDYWLDVNKIKNVQNKTTLATYLEWEIIDGLTFRPFVSIYKNDRSYGRYQLTSAYNGRRASNGYNDNNMNTQLDATLNYKKEIGDNHFVNALVGTSFINNYSYYVGGSTYGAATDLIYTMNAGALENDNVTSVLDQSSVQSWFGRVNYTFRNRYLITGSIRRDGASLFTEENKWANFPGVSAGWNLHNEDFWTVAPISALKIRASWGKTGKIRNIDIFDTQGQYSGFLYGGDVGVLNTQLANFDLVWETTTSYDIGFDMGLLGNKINVLFDYYYKNSHDRLYSKALPSFTGFSAITTNYGSYINRGVEFEVNATPVSGNITWNISLNWSYNKSVVGELPFNGKDKNRDGGWEVYDEASGEFTWVGGYAEGERPDAMLGLPNEGVFSTQEEADAWHVLDTYNKAAFPYKMAGDTKWSDRDGNGQIDGYDRMITGYKLPNHRGGLSSILTYKGLDFTIAMDWALGHTVWAYEELRIYANSQGEDRASLNVQNQWMHEGDVTSYPRTTRGDQNGPGNTQKSGANNASFYYPGDYLSFREIGLGYNFGEGITTKIPGVRGIRLNLTARNLGWLKNENVRNPEEVDGVDRYMYPVPFTINGGVKLTF